MSLSLTVTAAAGPAPTLDKLLTPALACCKPLPPCSNEYIAELGKLEGVKDNMIGGGQPVELAVELLK